LAKVLTAGESWTVWGAREWGSLQQKRNTNFCEYANHSYVEGCYETTQQGDHFGSCLQNAHFQRKTFGWSLILPQVLMGSRDVKFITRVMLFTTAKY